MLPHDELLAATVPLDPSAPDSTFAVHADGVMALSVERYLDELRLWHDLDPSLLGGLGGDHESSSSSLDHPLDVVECSTGTSATAGNSPKPELVCLHGKDVPVAGNAL